MQTVRCCVGNWDLFAYWQKVWLILFLPIVSFWPISQQSSLGLVCSKTFRALLFASQLLLVNFGYYCPQTKFVKVMFSQVMFVCTQEGVFVQGGLCPGSLCPGGSLSRWGLCPGGVSVQVGSLSRWGLCPGGVSVQGSLSRGVSVQGVSVKGVSVQGDPPLQLCPGSTHPTGMHSCLLNWDTMMI